LDYNPMSIIYNQYVRDVTRNEMPVLINISMGQIGCNEWTEFSGFTTLRQ